MLLERARAGFAGLTVAQAVQDAALTRLERWLADPTAAETFPVIHALADAGRWELLLDSFYQIIPFGTGGRRGPVGIGPNRINPWTLGTSIQGHCVYLRQRFGEGPLSVVIAYDVRRYLDSRGQSPAGVPNPVLGLSSRDFAEQAAGIYAANGVTARILARDSGTYLSTPELSFGIRMYGAQGGLNVSASHNPPDDNGAKVYDERGGQQVPPQDEELVTLVEAVTEVKRLSYEDGVAQGLIVPIGPELHTAYLQEGLDRSLAPQARSAKVVFTALHGTGRTTVYDLLRVAGFDTTLEPTQAEFDGRFPNVPFATPNPEVPQSMDRAVALAESIGADLVMACDPDADRLGVVVKHKGSWRFVTGNELGALCARHGLDHLGERARPPVMMKTEVTSSLFARLGRARGALVVDDLLVGFKYIADGLRSLEERGEFRGVKAELGDFLIGIEESHGVLVTPNLRDKDAAGASLWLAEAASLQKERGLTLIDLLEDCWREVGYVGNSLLSTVMRGATGRARIEQIQTSYRERPPTQIGPYTVTAAHDRRDPAGPFGAIRSGTDHASRDVLVFTLGDAGRVILRPSGTEPKNKVYVELFGTPGADPAVEVPRIDAACRALALDLAEDMLARAGLNLPRWAIQVSDLVAVEHKQRFAEVVLPGVVSRLRAGTPAEPFLDEELRAFGKDARGLVAPAVRAWLGEHAGEPPALAAALRALFGL
ncbi:MAG: phospho-sugar mutase [Deltaproteobacteria bacterium]|nr:phospho-sugar mutase [Deltaproteobacteria bacterium]